jgi:hypothetical protein
MKETFGLKVRVGAAQVSGRDADGGAATSGACALGKDAIAKDGATDGGVGGAGDAACAEEGVPLMDDDAQLLDADGGRLTLGEEARELGGVDVANEAAVSEVPPEGAVELESGIAIVFFAVGSIVAANDEGETKGRTKAIGTAPGTGAERAVQRVVDVKVDRVRGALAPAGHHLCPIGGRAPAGHVRKTYPLLRSRGGCANRVCIKISPMPKAPSLCRIDCCSGRTNGGDPQGRSQPGLGIRSHRPRQTSRNMCNHTGASSGPED